MKQIETVHIIGMGALGILFGNLLAEKLGGNAVTFIGDGKRVERFQKEGVFCNGKRCDFSMVQAGTQKPADLLIFAVKGTALSDAVKLAAHSVGEDTIILSLLNGISSEEVLAETFGEAHLVYTVAQGMDARREGNRLTCTNTGELRIGVPKGERPYCDRQRQNLLRVQELFDRTGLPYTEEEDILRRIWSKWMLNVGCNPTAMILEGTFGTLQTGGSGHQLAVDAMREVIAVANAEGIDLGEKDLQEYVDLLDSLNPEGMPSMRQDGLAKRYSEVELFNGTLIEKAKKHGISVPTNEKIYQRVKEIEENYESIR